jgi:hypothetical protein
MHVLLLPFFYLELGHHCLSYLQGNRIDKERARSREVPRDRDYKLLSGSPESSLPFH